MTKDFNNSANFSNNKNKEVLFSIILDFKLNCEIFLCFFVGLLKPRLVSFSIKYTSMLHTTVQL